ncbi:MAG: hypothetical protein ACP5M4_09800 [Acidobacteriaceae bacterium]
MKQVWQHGFFRFGPAVLVAVMGLWLLPGCAWAASSGGRKTAAAEAGCRDGWRRVGTMRDKTLGRSWAVVASCEHPAWPAHLEPASQWKALPERVSAGSKVVVTSAGGVTSMQLEGRTVAPGRVGQTVGVRLINRVLVEARLVAPGLAVMETVARWSGR